MSVLICSIARISLTRIALVAILSEKEHASGPAEPNTSAASAANCQLLLDALSDMVEMSQLIARDCDEVFQAGYLSSLVCLRRM